MLYSFISIASINFIYTLCVIFLVAYTIYLLKKPQRNFTAGQFAVFCRMVEEHMVLVIRLEKEKFQIIYDDGHAVNIWHPDFIDFFSFMEEKEVLNVYRIVEKRSKKRNEN